MKYAKAIVAVVGAAVTAALGLGLTGTAQQILTVLAAICTAATVYAVPNDKPVPDAVKAIQAQPPTS
jgi:hypothetical protein